MGQKCGWHNPPPSGVVFRAITTEKFINLVALKTPSTFVSQLALAGIGSLAFAALTPQPILAAPTLILKASFNGNGNGSNPQAALTPSGNGTFYGTTTSGGANGLGSIFEFDPNGGITLKASFNGAGNGANPYAALTPAGNGKFYGTAAEGGANGLGSIFEFDPNGGIILKASFNGAGNGANPYAALTPAGNGKFYGTTAYGGVNSIGSIFEFDPSGGGITLRASFTGDGSGNGTYPYAALTPAGNGNFFGTTIKGGANNGGSIYEFDTSAGSLILKASLPGDGGGSWSNSYAALTPSGNGTFYGTTINGGDNFLGSIFEFDPSSGGITLRASFDGAGNGANPFAALTPAGNGKFYGTANSGGANNVGTIFEFDPISGAITVKASFDGAGNGSFPYSALTPAGNGKFYGTASQGGANGLGSIFEFSDPDPTVGTPVPGPLPLMGVAAAFGWCRKLRRHIQQVSLGSPIGR